MVNLETLYDNIDTMLISLGFNLLKKGAHQ